MLNNEYITIIILVIININSILIGYLLGRLSNNGVINSKQSFFTRNQDNKPQNNLLSIDNKKFVTDIKTDGLERKYNTLGDVKQTEDNISSSVDKLKNLKR